MDTVIEPEALRSGLDPDPRPVAIEGDRLAAVLVPLIMPAGGPPSIVFTERRADLSRHGGEVSFPGGLPDPGDRGLAHTALREAQEELGIPQDAVEVLGGLEPVHTHVSRILVVPFVGVLRERPELVPSPGEIEAVFEFGLEELLEREAVQEWERGGERFITHVWEMDGATIWGATGRMLHTFLHLVRTGAQP
ncbi:MAG: CoA pyrophosphatase [Actinomycetota bacterium]